MVKLTRFSAMDLVKELFGTENLYEIFGVDKDKVTDEKALRSAYMKAALKYHPDKASEDDRETFTKKFQIIQKINELFKDEELRKIYDQTGTWPEDEKIEFDGSSFGRLDENAILEFKKMYQGSDEERQDIKKCYEESGGDIFHICDNVFFLNVLDDEERVQGIIDDLIEKGEMKQLTNGVKSDKVRQKKLAKARKEAQEAEELQKERNLGGGMEDLMKAIARNNASRNGFLDQLEQKYGGAKAGRSKRGKKKADSTVKEPAAKKAKSDTSNNAGNESAGTRTRSRGARK